MATIQTDDGKEISIDQTILKSPDEIISVIDLRRFANYVCRFLKEEYGVSELDVTLHRFRQQIEDDILAHRTLTYKEACERVILPIRQLVEKDRREDEGIHRILNTKVRDHAKDSPDREKDILSTTQAILMAQYDMSGATCMTDVVTRTITSYAMYHSEWTFKELCEKVLADCAAILELTPETSTNRVSEKRDTKPEIAQTLEKAVTDLKSWKVPTVKEVSGRSYKERYLQDARLFDSVNDVIAKVKPINLSCFFIDVLTADHPATIVASIGRILESYGVLWRGTNQLSNDVLNALQHGMQYCATQYEELNTLWAGKEADLFSRIGAPLTAHANDKDYESLFKLLETSDPEVNESLHAIGPIAKVIVPMAMVGLSAIGVYKPAAPLVNAVKSMAGLCKDSKTLLTTFDGVKKAVDFGFDAAFNNQKLHLFDEITKELVQLIKKLHAHKSVLSNDEGAVLTDSEKKNRILGDCDRVVELAQLVSQIKDEKTGNINPLIVSALKLDGEIRTMIGVLENTSSYKLEPVVIWLYGQPGVGKSTLCHYLIKLLGSLEGRPLTTYTRNSCEQYMSGYRGQEVVIYDDFGSAAEGYDVAEFIPTKSPSANNLNMAAVEEKGKKFTSKYIIICSNICGIQATDQVANPEATDRRRDFLFQVTDPTAVANMAAGVANRHYKDDYSHLFIAQLNPIRNAQGSYSFVKTTYPTDMVRMIFEKRQFFEETYRSRLEELKDPQIIDIDSIDDTPQIVIQRPEDVQRVFGTASAADISLRRRNPQPAPAPRQNQGRRDRPRGRNQLAVDLAAEELIEHAVTVGGNKLGVLITGEAGTGKTFLLEQILPTAALERQIAVEVYDEFQMDDKKNKRAIEHVWNYFDGKTDVMPILVTNTLPTRIKCGHSVDALLRRVVHYEFSFTISAKVARSLNRTVEHPTCTRVVRKTQVEGEVRTSQVISYPNVVDAILTGKTVEIRSVEIGVPDWVADKPEMCVYIHASVKDVQNYTFKDFLSGKVKVTIGENKLTLTDKMKLYAATSKITDVLGSDIDKTLKVVNMKGITTSVKQDILFCFKDDAYVMSTSTGKIVIHTYHKTNPRIAQMEYTAGLLKDTKKSQEKYDTFSVVMEFVEGLYFFIKFGGLLTACVFSGMDRMATHKMIQAAKEKIQSEGITSWADQVEVEMKDVDYSKVPEHPSYAPKNTRQRSGLEDSDASLRIATRQHIEYESNERLAPPKPTPRKEVSSTELLNEARAVLTKQLLGGKQAAKKPLIESSSTEHIKRIPATASVDLDKLPTLSAIPTHLKDSQLMEQSVKMLQQNKELEPLVEEAMKDDQAFALIPMIRRNTVYVGTPDKIILRGLMIHGNIGVTNAHAISGWSVGDIFNCFEYLNQDTQSYVGEVLELNTKMDYCIFKLRDGRNFTSILKHLPKKTDNANYDNMTGWLLYCYPDNSQIITNVMVETKATKSVGSDIRHGLVYKGHAAHMEYGPINSKPGLCGSAVIVTNPRVQRKIVAIHGAANTVVGLGALVYQEMFEILIPHSACHGLTQEITVLKHQCVLPVKPMRIGKTFVIVGVPHDGEKILQQHHPSKTKLYKSPLALDEDSPFEPAVLSKFDDRPLREVDVFVEGVMQYDREQAQMDESELDIVIEEIADFYAETIYKAGIRLKVLTKTEALNGVSYISQSNPLTRDTSSGFPWKHMTPNAKKDDFLVFNGDQKHWEIAKNQYGQALHHGVDGLIQAARRGERTAVVNVATLKDEPRKLKRIYEEPATRTFWAAPLDKVIADRMYFHAAIAAIAATHEKHPIKIGINPQALGFHKLYLWLASRSEIGFDLDTKNWDSSVPRCVIERLYKVYNRIYEVNDPTCSEEEQQIRKTLHQHLVCPLVLLYDFVVQLPGGNISGQTFTAVDNSIVNHIYHYYAWRQIMRRAKRPRDMTLEAFHSRVGCAFYGDDAVNAVDYNYAKLFSPEAYVAECAKIGVKCTPADKSTQPRLKHVLELEFLKRNFVRATLPSGKAGPYFCGALQLDSFRKMLDYTICSRGHDFFRERHVIKFDANTLGQVIACALIEATNYGRGFFDKLSSHLRQRCREYGIHVDNWPSYIACYNMLWNLDLPNGSQDVETLQNHSTDMTTQPAVAGEGHVASPPLHGPGTPVDPAEVPATQNSQMIDQFTGDYGTLPREIYEKDILIATVPWNSTQMAATPLWYQEMKPSTINAYAGYFSAPYNAWAGGAIFTFIIVGTGFHGGKLMVVRFPPNYDISQIRSTQDLTVFHNITIDAKETMPTPKELVDERNVLFHWRFEHEGVNSRGGTLGIFVLSPLINASGGVTNINVVIFGRPAPDFRVSQLMPLPTLSESPNYLPFFRDLLRLEGLCVNEAVTEKKITRVRVAASTVRFFTTRHMFGHVNTDGEPRKRVWRQFPKTLSIGLLDSVTSTRHVAPFWMDATQSYVNQTDLSAEDIALNVPVEWIADRPLIVDFTPQGSTAVRDRTATIHQYIKVATEAGFRTGSNNAAATPDTRLDLRKQTVVLSTEAMAQIVYTNVDVDCAYEQVDENDGSDPLLKWTPPVGESLVFFGTEFYKTFTSAAPDLKVYESSQTTNMIDQLSNGLAKGIMLKGQALLFNVTDRETNLPIETFKLYYEGFVTASLSGTNIVYKAENLVITPFEFIPATTPIPTRPELVMNRLLIQSRDRAVIRQDAEERVVSKVLDRLEMSDSRPPSRHSVGHPEGTLPMSSRTGRDSSLSTKSRDK